jgi:hypothetical protein
MTTLLAIAHFAGVVVAYFLFGIVSALLGEWNAQRVSKKLVGEAAMSLGLTTDELDDAKNNPQVERYLAQRSSSELLRNRFSDLAGLLLTIFYWICGIASLLVLLGVGYATVTDELANAVHVWWILPLNLVGWVIGLVWCFTCLLLTGRYPGEAKLARKGLLQAIEQRKATEDLPLSEDEDDDWAEDDTGEK